MFTCTLLIHASLRYRLLGLMFSVLPGWVLAVAAMVEAGGAGFVAIYADGTRWGWGGNDKGELGDSGTTDSKASQQIDIGYVIASAGGFHTLALKADGSLWAWGENNAGQLGDGSLAASRSPTQILPSVFATAIRQIDCVFNWAERSYPGIFSPASAGSSTLSDYYYRFYSGCGTYLYETQSNNHLGAFGPLTGSTLLDLGSAVTWAANAGCP